MITFNEIEADEIPFLRVEFDNSLNFDPFDVSLRVLMIAGTDSATRLEKPTLVSSKDQAGKLFGAGDRMESLVDSWYKSSSIPLHVFTHPVQQTIDEWKAVIQKIVDTDKLFDLVILLTVRRTAIKEAASIFSQATLKDGAIKPLVTTAFQISADDAISYMNDPKFVFPPAPGANTPNAAPPSAGGTTPNPKPVKDGQVVTTPQVEGVSESVEIQPATGRIKRSKAEETAADEPEQEASMPRAALRAAGFDAATIPNLENLCILPVAPIKGDDGQSLGVPDALISIKFAAEIANAAQKNPARPFNGLSLKDVKPFRREDAYSRKQLNDCVKNGLCACSVDGNGQIVLERVVTTRRQDSRGEPDYSMADANVNLIDNYLKKTFTNYFWNAYISQRAVLVDDNATVPANVDFPVIKPRTAKAEALNVFRIWQEKLVVQDEDAFLDSLKVERDGKTLKFSFKARYIQGLLGIQAKIYRAR